MGNAPLRIQLLGGFAVSLAGRPVPPEAWRLRKAKSLIKLLALAAGHRALRSEVGELLWPERSPASVSNNCAQALHVARRALETCGADAGAIVSAPDGVLALREPVQVDLEVFEQAAATAADHRTLGAVRAALDLYTGELLPEDLYEDWTTARREAVREERLRLLMDLADLHVANGHPAEAIAVLERVVVADPLHEAAHRALMRLFAAYGRRQHALAQYERLRRALRRALEADPDPATRRLYRQILSGEHEPLPRRPAGNLPRARTSFVGRERELADLTRLLERTRILTLTGPGGCGKTRLALELAAAVQGRFPHGAWLVELASVSDDALVAPAIAAALGLQLRSQRDPCDVLVDHVRARRLLLILDNCEHLAEPCARVAARLEGHCRDAVVVATSREPLHIAGELVWRVPSLSLPVPDRPSSSEAVQLFQQRAAEADEDLPAIVEICLRLDGMPLAIELAAARTGILSPAQIAERLGNSLALLRTGDRAVLTRQQTLQGTLAWSHDLLTGRERTLFRRLSIFAGTFDIDAVECVCSGHGIETAEVVDLLGRLVDKSLVQCAHHRYGLLETVRQYGRERLHESGEAERLDIAHREYFAARAQAATSPEALDPDHDDLRAALTSALARDPPLALRMATALEAFWMARGHFAEGARWLAEALAAAPTPTTLRARALLTACALDVRRGAPQRIVELGRESVEILRGQGDRARVAWALGEVGLLQMVKSDFAHGRRTFDASIAVGDRAIAAGGRLGQGVIAYCQGDYGGARSLLETGIELFADMPEEPEKRFRATHANPVITLEGPAGTPRCVFEDTLHTFRPIGVRAASAYARLNVGEAWRAEGRYAPARASIERALTAFREGEDATGVAAALTALGNLARSAGDLGGAVELLEEGLAMRRRLGDRRDIGMSLASLGLLNARAGDADAARAAIHEATVIFGETEDRPGLAGMLQDLGWVELETGHPATAIGLLERAVVTWRQQLVIRGAGWTAALLAEAAEAAGDPAGARQARLQAMDAFRQVGEARGLAHVEALARRPLTLR